MQSSLIFPAFDMDEIDLYEVLEITRGSSKVEIKKAYHKVSLSLRNPLFISYLVE